MKVDVGDALTCPPDLNEAISAVPDPAVVNVDVGNVMRMFQISTML